MNDNTRQDLRLPGGHTLLTYFKNFSPTEKVIFGIVAVALVASALSITSKLNSYFMVRVPAHGGTLHEGLVGLPHALNPVLAVTDADRDITSLVYSGLTAYSGTSIIPDLAESWDISPDGMTYTFNLKKDLKFHNGTPLTADDVMFTIEKIKSPIIKSPRAADWSGITATSTSPTTVVFNLKQPYSSFLINTTVGILPKSLWSKVSDEQFIFSEYNMKPVGSGPYAVEDIIRDKAGVPTHYSLSASNQNSISAPYISNIDFTFFPDIDHAVTALKNGTIDSLSSIPPATAQGLDTTYKVKIAPTTRIFGVFFNQNKNPILGDANVRKALNLSVDRNNIVMSTLFGFGTPIGTPLPSTLSQSTTTPLAQDMSNARSLLQKSGWKLGSNGIYSKKPSKTTASTTLTFTLYTADTPDLKQVAELLKTSWRNLGVDVTVKIFEPSELYQNIIRAREYDALLFGEALGKTVDLYAFWHSSQRNSPGLNISMYTNSKADKILESIRSATDTEARRDYYRQFENIIADDMPAIFLYSPQFTYIVPDTVSGVRLDSITTPYDRFAHVRDWYIETERVWKLFTDKTN